MGRLLTIGSKVRTRRIVASLLAMAAALVWLMLPGRAQAVHTPSATVVTAEPTPADGSSSGLEPGSFVDVIEVSGLLDPVLSDYVDRSIAASESAGAVAVVLQIDSEGSVLDPDELDLLVSRIASATVPIDVWVGPSGSGATRGSAAIGAVADRFAMAPGTRYGLDGTEVSRLISDLAVRPIPEGIVTDEEAAEQEITSFAAPTIGDFLVNLDGFETREVVDGDETRREPVTLVRFFKLSLVASIMHGVASPAVAYLLFVIGLALFVFELYTAGIGIAGTVGAVCFVLGSYGLAALPVRAVAVALLAGSFLAFAVDVQTGVPRFWTGVGLTGFVVATLLLYDGVSMSWLTVLVGIGGVLLTFLSGMPSMVRTRFSTPTIGREWMTGSMGVAVTDVNPDGVVKIDGAQWRATTNRATPIEQLDPVRVIGIDGLVLEVEPETGGARDYRQRGGPSSTTG